MTMSSTSEATILPNAAPMITPTARSTTLPFTAKSLNSVSMLMGISPPGFRIFRLPQPPLAVDVVGVLRAVAERSGPGDGLHHFRALGLDQPGELGLEVRKTRRRNVIFSTRGQRRVLGLGRLGVLAVFLDKSFGHG